MQQRLRVDVVHVLRPCPLPGCTQSVWVWQVAPSQGKLKRGPPAASTCLPPLWKSSGRKPGTPWTSRSRKVMGQGCAVTRRGVPDRSDTGQS